MKRNVYKFKGSFKSFLFILALLITFGFLYYTQLLVGDLQRQTREYMNFRAKIIEEHINNDEVEDLSFFFNNVILTADYPVISTDTQLNPNFWQLDDIPSAFNGQVGADTLALLRKRIEEFREINPPIQISYQGQIMGYYFYGESATLQKLRRLPLIQILVVAMFVLIGYAGFSSIKRSEQRFIWVGMAKETAHQLGTPLSSQAGWLEYLKASPEEISKVIPEMEKDLKRLDTIANRFSQIGSLPNLKEEVLYDVTTEIVEYFRRRLPRKNVITQIDMYFEDKESTVNVNKDLFSWVLENLIKNGLDALGNNGGTIRIDSGLLKEGQIYIDVSDTGKGISNKDKRNIFKPGFSTKKRGWGLGLSLSKRIVEEYHGGKLFLKESQLDVGSRFRLILKTNPKNVT